MRGRELKEADKKISEASSETEPQPTNLQRQFVLASREQEEKQRRNIILGLSFGLIVMVALAIFAWLQRNNALEQARIALARQMVAQAQSISVTRSSKQMTAMLLATQSMKMNPSSEAAQVLLSNPGAILLERALT